MEVDRSRLQDEPRVAAQGCSAMDAPRQKKTRPSKRDLEENDGERAEGERPEPAVGTYSSSRRRDGGPLPLPQAPMGAVRTE